MPSPPRWHRSTTVPWSQETQSYGASINWKSIGSVLEPASGWLRVQTGLSLDLDACIFRNASGESCLQHLSAVHRDRDHFALTGLRINVVASVDAPERPAVLLDQPAHLGSGDRFQTATSRN